MPARPQEARGLSARIAAHSSWAATVDPTARTAPARAASAGRFEQQVDPEGLLDPADRARRAAHARRAHFLRMQLLSVESRRKAAALISAAEAAEAELADGGDAE